MRLFNTLTRKVEEVRPLRPKEFRFYVCGPTIYDLPHIGHARVYTVFDVLRRYWEWRGFRVLHVMNFTDVDDKMIKRSRERGISIFELATEMAVEFLRDFLALGLRLPSVIPTATAHIPEIIEFVKGLVEKGYAYESSDGVYFSVRKLKTYGQLSGQRLDALRAGARVEPGDKRDPLDFALWKKQKPGEPAWPSPWGPGRPGWHVECSAMILKHLGKADLHGGGMDLVFPHHENEIAQTLAFTGDLPADHWMHVGLLRIEGEKMSKSLGNFITIREALKKIRPRALKAFYLLHPYRAPLNFTWEGVAEADRLLQRIERNLQGGDTQEKPDPVAEGLFKRAVEALENDFSTREAFLRLLDLSERAGESRVAQTLSITLMELLGLTPQKDPREEFARKLLELRDLFRRRREYGLSDSLRKWLVERGVEVLDEKEGSRPVFHW